MSVGLTCAHLLLRRQVAYLQQYAYDPSVTWAVSAVSGLTLGSVAVILLGDKITHLKLGNGTSLLIFTNIVSYLPFYALFSPVFFSLFLQAIGQVAYLQQYAYDPSVAWAVSAVSGLTLGSVAVILLGDKITDLKLGNGTSLLIFTNIVSYLPASIGRTITEASEQGNVTGEALLLASFLLLVFGIVYVQEAERRILINYASRNSQP
ncbi:unnamed protein product [Closterium sp. NIES-54]